MHIHGRQKENKKKITSFRPYELCMFTQYTYIFRLMIGTDVAGQNEHKLILSHEVAICTLRPIKIPDMHNLSIYSMHMD